MIGFRDFIIKEENAWGARYKYLLPESPKEQLFDFYMLSFLKVRESSNEKINFAFQEVEQILLPSLKDKLLGFVFYAIACEFRHIWDSGAIEGNVKNAQRNLSTTEYALFGKWVDHFQASKNQTDGLLNSKAPDAYDQYEHISRTRSADAAIHANPSKVKFIELAHKMFNHDLFKWSESYGGQAWIDICNAWLKLYHATSLAGMYSWIDHLYDLQHNTGSVFTKIGSFAIDGGYFWISEALDLKARIKNPLEIIDHISSKMRILALPAIKSIFGHTLQSRKDLNTFELSGDSWGGGFAVNINYKGETQHLTGAITNQMIFYMDHPQLVKNLLISFLRDKYQPGMEDFMIHEVLPFLMSKHKTEGISGYLVRLQGQNLEALYPNGKIVSSVPLFDFSQNIQDARQFINMLTVNGVKQRALYLKIKSILPNLHQGETLSI